MITIHCLRSGRFPSYFILVYACTATDMLCCVLNCLVASLFCTVPDSVFQKTKILEWRLMELSYPSFSSKQCGTHFYLLTMKTVRGDGVAD